MSITVSFWSGGYQYGGGTSNLSRPDVGAILGDSGLHGFSVPFGLPSTLNDGASHNIEVHYDFTAAIVGSPITLVCPSTAVTNYTGYIDSSSCGGINGWAADKKRPGTPITVSLWDGATQIALTTANGSRSDVGAALGDNGLHGFSMALPSTYATGVSHTLQVHYETSGSALGSPVTLTCGSIAPRYAGYIDSSSCSGINGWAADKNRLNTPIAVTLWDGNQQIASTMANGSRSDVGSAIGDNGVHGFSLALPSSYADGASHGLQVHYELSSSVIGSTVTLTCGSSGNAPNYAGYVDQLTCSTIGGWAADRNSLNSSVLVNIYDGSTLLGTTSANASRGDVGSYLNDNGLHRFDWRLPHL